MSFQNSLKKLESSSEFKSFKTKNKKAFLFSAFFVFNSKLEIDTEQFNYYISEKKVIVFDVKDSITSKTDELEPHDKITKIDSNIKIDTDELKKIIEKEIETKKLGAFDVSKIICILQNIDGKQVWNVTCLMSSLKMLRMQIDCFSGKIIKSEEASLFDMMKIKKNYEAGKESV